jgi:hypothetical protein
MWPPPPPSRAPSRRASSGRGGDRMRQMLLGTEAPLLRACRVLFGANLAARPDFLRTLDKRALKRAYRQRALLTHPDRLSVRVGSHKAASADSFIESTRAYEALLQFLDRRGRARIPEPPARAAPVPDPPRPRAVRLPSRSLLFAEFLYYSGAIGWNDLIAAIVWQRRQRPRFGDIGLRWRLLSSGGVNKLLAHRQPWERVGDAAVRLRLLSHFHVRTILAHQRIKQRPIGRYFVEQGLLSPGEVEVLAQRCERHNRRWRGQ